MKTVLIALFLLFFSGCQSNKEKEDIEFNWLNGLPIICKVGSRELVVKEELGFEFYSNIFIKKGVIIGISKCRIPQR